MTNFERLIEKARLLEKEAEASLGYLYTFDRNTGEKTEEHWTGFTGESFSSREEAFKAAVAWLKAPAV